MPLPRLVPPARAADVTARHRDSKELRNTVGELRRAAAADMQARVEGRGPGG